MSSRNRKVDRPTMSAPQSTNRGECQMVAYEYFDNKPQPEVSAAPPASPPPKRFRRGLLVAVTALGLASGAGSGAAAAALIGQGTASASTGTALPTTQTSTGSTSSSTAASIYKQDLPGVVTLIVNLSRGQAIGSGIVLDSKGDILTNAHVLAGAQNIQVAFSDGTTVAATLVGSNTGADLAVIRHSGYPDHSRKGSCRTSARPPRRPAPT